MSIISYVHPLNGLPLQFSSNFYFEPLSLDKFPVVNGIPRFCALDNYSKSFGYQWNSFDRTQLDPFSGSDHSYQRFYCETGWNPKQLNSCSVLEVGCGAGRFSEVFLRTTSGVLHSVDYSSAVDANSRNNSAYGERLQLSQASIYELPFPDNSFDKVFCLGVLQHTPVFADSVASLIRKARVGGEIVVDFYPINGWYARFIQNICCVRLPSVCLSHCSSSSFASILSGCCPCLIFSVLFASDYLLALSRSQMFVASPAPSRPLTGANGQ